MAFEVVSSKSDYKKWKDIKVGEKLTAYILGTEESVKYPGTFALKMRGEDGKDFVLATGGTLKYFAKDMAEGKDPKRIPGYLTQITRLESYRNKNGQEVSNWEIAIDFTKPVAEPLGF